MLTPRNANRPNRLSSCVRLRLRVDIHREDAAIVNRQSVAAAVAAVFLAAVAASAAGLVLHRPIVLAFNFSHLCRALGS